MIRAMKEEDGEAVVDIWLRASLQSHAFVEEGYWESRVEDMRNVYLPLSEVVVDEEAPGTLAGFMALIGDHLAALFVAPEHQGKGTGTRLLRLAQKMRPELHLCVYAENGHAVAFYLKHGFTIQGERHEEATGQKEWLMSFCSHKMPSDGSTPQPKNSGSIP